MEPQVGQALQHAVNDVVRPRIRADPAEGVRLEVGAWSAAEALAAAGDAKRLPGFPDDLAGLPSCSLRAC